MTTLLFVDQYAAVGGGQAVLLHLVHKLRPRARVVLAAPGGPFLEHAADGGVETFEVDPVKARQVKAFMSTLSSLGPARIVANGARALPACIVLARATGGKPARMGFIDHSTPGSLLRRSVRRAMLAGVDDIFPVAATQRRGRQSIDLPPLGLTAEEVAAIETRPALSGLPPVKAYGRLDPMKGLDVLAEALAVVAMAVPEMRAEVAVRPSLEGSPASYQSATLAALEPHLVAGERTSSWFSTGDIVVVPSRYGEAVCLTAQEAMLRGATVIAPRIGDLKEFVVPSVTGFNFRAGDPADLASTLIHVLRLDDEERQEVARAARRLMIARAEHWYSAIANVLVP